MSKDRKGFQRFEHGVDKPFFQKEFQLGANCTDIHTDQTYGEYLHDLFVRFDVKDACSLMVQWDTCPQDYMMWLVVEDRIDHQMYQDPSFWIAVTQEFCLQQATMVLEKKIHEPIRQMQKDILEKFEGSKQ